MLQLSWRLVCFGPFIQPLFWESVIKKTPLDDFTLVLCDLYTFSYFSTSNKLQVWNVAKLASTDFRIKHTSS